MTDSFDDDLRLARACLDGDASAIAILDETAIRPTERALARLGLEPAAIDDVLQSVRELLLAPPEPHLARYEGRGPLRAWVRVIAVRTARRTRAQVRDVPAEQAMIEAVATGTGDPELDHLRQVCRDAFREAFAAAMQALPQRARLLLKQHFVDGLSIDRLAALHGVHRATAARWIEKARETLAVRTRRGLMQWNGVARGDYDSIVRLIGSDLDLSIRRYLE
jgi:RNA polymerase sigma-70 factor (ECF subfamily)